MGKSTKHQVFGYLSRQPKELLSRLFECTWSCGAILRLLSPIAKQIVFKLVFIPGDVNKHALDLWGKNSLPQGKPYLTAITSLIELCILNVFQNNTLTMLQLRKFDTKQEDDDGNIKIPENSRISLNPSFRNNLIKMISEESIKLPFNSKDVDPNIDLNAVEEKSSKRWEGVLRYIAASDGSIQPGEDVKKLIENMKLVGRPNTNSSLSITNTGYEFMLQDYSQQIWQMCEAFVEYRGQQAEKDVVAKSLVTQQRQKQQGKGQENDSNSVIAKAALLNFLFSLSFCVAGAQCFTDTLDDVQKVLAYQFFSDIGLLYKKEGKNFFYVTSLGVTAVFGQSATQRLASATLSAADQTITNKRHIVAVGAQENPIAVSSSSALAHRGLTGMLIICETNFRVYTYTQSELHAEMLKLFIQLECALPNMIVGVITRESIGNALNKGISAEQIIHFLSINAHPLCTKQRVSVIPDNVSDMILLWEKERDRVKVTKGCLYHDFVDFDLFKKVQDFALKNNALAWSNTNADSTTPSRDLKLFTTSQGDEKVRDYIKQLTQGGQKN